MCIVVNIDVFPYQGKGLAILLNVDGIAHLGEMQVCGFEYCSTECQLHDVSHCEKVLELFVLQFSVNQTKC